MSPASLARDLQGSPTTLVRYLRQPEPRGRVAVERAAERLARLSA